MSYCTLVGGSSGTSFPTTPGAYQTEPRGPQSEGFVAKLASDGSRVLWATLLGGYRADSVTGLAVDPFGEVVVVGFTESVEFPVTSGAFDTSQNGGRDVFVAKLSADGSRLIWSTFLGGKNEEYPSAVALDAAGDIVVAGTTGSSDFRASPSAYGSPHKGLEDGFVVKVSADGSRIAWGSFLGGRGIDSIRALVLDRKGDAVVAGVTSSDDFPASPSASYRRYGGNGDAFVAKLPGDGTGLPWATFLGGSYSDGAGALALDSGGSIIVAGWTESPDFPGNPGSYGAARGGDVFVVKFHNSPPRAAFTWEPQTPIANETVVTFADASHDPDGEGDLAAWLWEFGDGVTSSRRHPTHSYRAVGSYTVRLTVTDAFGATASESRVIRVTARPVAVGKPVRHALVGSPTTLTGAQSYHPDPARRVIGYRWQLVGKPAASQFPLFWSQTGSQSEVTFIPDVPGTYTFSLVVEDDLYALSHPATVPIEAFLILSRPNPAREHVAFVYNPALGGSTLMLYAITGRMVRRLELSPTGSTLWDLTDFSGQPVASGIYLWLVVDRDGKPLLNKPERLVVQR